MLHIFLTVRVVAPELYSHKVDKLVNICLKTDTGICAMHIHTYENTLACTHVETDRNTHTLHTPLQE